MSQLDVLLLVLLALFALRGLLRGFFRESFGLVGVAAGAIAAGVWGGTVGTALRAHDLVPHGTELVAGPAAVLIVVWLAAVILGRLAERVARVLFLGGLSRAAGVLVGSAKGAVLLGLGLLLAERLWPAASEAIAASRLGRPLMQLAREAVDIGRRIGAAPAGGHA